MEPSFIDSFIWALSQAFALFLPLMPSIRRYCSTTFAMPSTLIAPVDSSLFSTASFAVAWKVVRSIAFSVFSGASVASVGCSAASFSVVVTVASSGASVVVVLLSASVALGLRRAMIMPPLSGRRCYQLSGLTADMGTGQTLPAPIWNRQALLLGSP